MSKNISQTIINQSQEYKIITIDEKLNYRLEWLSKVEQVDPQKISEYAERINKYLKSQEYK